MAQYKNFDIGTKTIGSPFNGAATGTSVTISSTVMRGSSAIAGAVRIASGHQNYTPLDKRWASVPLTDRTIKISTITSPVLPVTLPFTQHVKQQPVSITSYTAFSNSSFTAPTISSTVMRMSTAEIGSLGTLKYQTPAIDTYNYYKVLTNTWQELQVFGSINRMLFMDY